MNLVNYRLYHGGELPPPTGLYEYVLAANGVFVRAARAGLYAQIPVARADRPGVRGLAVLPIIITLDAPKISAEWVSILLDRARSRSPLETLFWLRHDTTMRQGWQVWEPEQHRTPSSCRPADPYDPTGSQALIDLHSHHEMNAFFSAQDNRDEGSTFRLYAVLGKVSTAPEIALRVGVYGHFYDLYAPDYFDLPDGMLDAAERAYAEETAAWVDMPLESEL